MVLCNQLDPNLGYCRPERLLYGIRMSHRHLKNQALEQMQRGRLYWPSELVPILGSSFDAWAYVSHSMPRNKTSVIPNHRLYRPFKKIRLCHIGDNSVEVVNACFLCWGISPPVVSTCCYPSLCGLDNPLVLCLHLVEVPSRTLSEF